MSAWPLGHVGRARYRDPQGRPQDDEGGGRSGRGRRELWSHHEANTGRPRVRQVPIQGSDTDGGVHVPPIRKTGIPQTLQEDQGPLFIQSPGTTENPSGYSKPLKPSGCRPLLDKSEELQTGLKKSPGRSVGRAQAFGRQVGKSRPYDQGQTPEVFVVANLLVSPLTVVISSSVTRQYLLRAMRVDRVAVVVLRYRSSLDMFYIETVLLPANQRARSIVQVS